MKNELGAVEITSDVEENNVIEDLENIGFYTYTMPVTLSEFPYLHMLVLQMAMICPISCKMSDEGLKTH